MPSISFSLLTLSGIAGLVLLYVLPRIRQRQRPAFPPGPESPDMPTLNAWVKYQEWGKEYGDLIYIRAKNMLITGSPRVARDLLEKRGRIYSDRESSLSVLQCGADRIVSLQRYNDKFRRHKKFFEHHFRQSNSSRFYSAQYAKVHEFLRNLATDPERFMQHTMTVMYTILYGLDISYDDPLARKTVGTVATLGQVFITGFPTLERFPWLRFMPSWFPGCGYKRAANTVSRNLNEIDTIPFEQALDNLKMGRGTSLVAELALKYEGMPAEIEMLKAMGTTSFVGASDTTMSTISSFLLALTLHPEVQAKAQAEIDRVIGRDRLPTLQDRQHLPYVQSIYRELMRLYPAVPLGINHVSVEDDIYEGYYIPKGCVVVPNIWAMNRDPNVYPEPDKFNPERFFASPSGPFTSINDIYAYGFGRRICIGRYMADNTVWLAMASILATLDLCKAKDIEGNEIDIPGDFTNVFFLYPKPYQNSIMPRDQQARELILATAAAVESK